MLFKGFTEDVNPHQAYRIKKLKTPIQNARIL